MVREVASHEGDHLLDLVVHVLIIEVQPLEPFLSKAGLHALGPLDLIDGEDDLSRPLFEPVGPVEGDGVEVHDAVFHDFLEGHPHLLLDLAQPDLDIGLVVFGGDLVEEGDALVLDGGHAQDVRVRVELQLVNAFEALLQVRLH